MIKLVLAFLFATILFSLLDITTLPNLIGSIINYLSSGSLYEGIKNIFQTIGGFFDTLLFNSESVVYTSGGIELSSLVWVGMIARILLVLFLIRLLIKVVL